MAENINIEQAEPQAEINQAQQMRAEWREKAVNILRLSAKIKDLLMEEKDNQAPSNQFRNTAELLFLDVYDLLREFGEYGEDMSKWYFVRVIYNDEPIEAFGTTFDGFGDLIHSLRFWDIYFGEEEGEQEEIQQAA